MKARFIVPLVICCVMTLGSIGTIWVQAASEYGTHAHPKSDLKLLQLEQTTIDLYTSAYKGNRSSAYVQVQQLQREINQLIAEQSSNKAAWTMLESELRFIQYAITNQDEKLNWLEPATRIRLAIDALLWDDKALWNPYEKLLQEDLSGVRQAWQGSSDGHVARAQARLVSLKLHAERIEIAATLKGDRVRMEELLKRIQYLNQLLDTEVLQHASQYGKKTMASELDAIEAAIAGIYRKDTTVTAQPVIPSPASANPTQWALFLGVFISAILTYIGWRKYNQNPYGVKEWKG